MPIIENLSWKNFRLKHREIDPSGSREGLLAPLNELRAMLLKWCPIVQTSVITNINEVDVEDDKLYLAAQFEVASIYDEARKFALDPNTGWLQRATFPLVHRLSPKELARSYKLVHNYLLNLPRQRHGSAFLVVTKRSLQVYGGYEQFIQTFEHFFREVQQTDYKVYHIK